MNENNIEVCSPDGLTRLTLFPGGSQMHFSVSFGDNAVIALSPLTMTVDGVDLTGEATAGDVVRYQVDETYPWRGVHNEAINHCEGVRIVLASKDGTDYVLDMRAYNDGVAFRLVVPGEGSRVPDEATQFVLPEGSTVWYHDLEGHYEGMYDKRNIDEVAAGDWAAPPVTFQLPNGAGYASITEAALMNYSGMALKTNGSRGFQVVLGHAHHVSYPFRLRYEEHIERLKEPAAVDGEITTPWRVVLVGKDLNALVNCDAIHNLCPPPDETLFPDGLNTEWIRPGRAVWRYLDGGERTLDGMKDFSRWAGELGFEHHVIEGFWREWPEEDLKALTAYSAEQGVGIWLWKHSRDLRDVASREAFFDLCHLVGAVGAKVDFFDHEAKEVVDLYYEILREAAKRELLICFHGSNKPTGEPRTWPNELNRESIRGMEARKMVEKARHNTTLPFTRFLAGHADYTPVHFGERLGDTTAVHQIASAIIFTSSLLTYSAHPQTLLNHPCVDVIKAIPVLWDETVVLPASAIGEVAAFARRNGDVWFLAVMNGPGARSVEIPLAFLDAGDFQAQWVKDDASDATMVQMEQDRLGRDDMIRLDMRGGGGFIAQFAKE